MIKVIVSGAAGKMGREVCRAVIADSELALVAAVDANPQWIGRDVGDVTSDPVTGISVADDLETAIRSASPDVMVDFTHPKSVLGNVEKALSLGVDCVIGTTGIDARFAEIEAWAQAAGRRAFAAANFTTGAVLMMHFAKIASKYFPGAEIIELHHDQKADAPSGTSVATAVSMALRDIGSIEVGEETFPGARGALVDGIRVHSVRLPGYVAHQEVIFGAPGQTLSIRHDSIDRAAYMPGVILAVKSVGALEAPFTFGLEKIMGLGDLEI